MRPIRLWHVLFAGALFWIGLLLQRGRPLHWDEIEFFRATRWIAEGRTPYAGFWEHHAPLQWLVFAPFAGVLSSSPGVSAIVTLRWLQVPLWIGTFALVILISRRAGSSVWGCRAAVAMLLASPLFVFSALEYRVDTLGNAFFVGAVALLVSGDLTRWTAIAFGVLGSCAVLSNMRMAPLVAITALLAFLWRPSEERWCWNGRAAWMAAGIALVGSAFVGWLRATGAWTAFIDGVVRYNTTSNALVHIDVNTLRFRLLEPATSLDPAALAVWLAALAGLAVALRNIRRPPPSGIIAVLFIATIVTLVPLGVHYAYHLQTTYLLMPVLAGFAAERLAKDWERAGLVRGAAAGIVTIALLIQYIRLLGPSFGVGMKYQDLVMRVTDERTTKDDAVWDGVGYALRREPAYHYWFLPTGVRLMAERGLIAPYDIEHDPPAAIIHGYRVNQWLRSFPRVGRYAVHHYVPLFRDLWIPGMSATVEQGPMRWQWRVPATGRYKILASELLVRHPWFNDPLSYALGQDEAAIFEIPLDRLPRIAGDTMRWTIDGHPVPPGAQTLNLAKGSVLVLVSTLRQRAGVLVVPDDVHTLCAGPERPVFF